MKRLTGLFLSVFIGAYSFSVPAAEWQVLPDVAPAPADNPTTPEKVELGHGAWHRLLYEVPDVCGK